MPKYKIRNKIITIELKKKVLLIKEEIIILLIVAGFIIPYFLQIVELSRRSRLWPTFITITISILLLFRLVRSVSIIDIAKYKGFPQETNDQKADEGDKVKTRFSYFKSKFTLFPLLSLLLLVIALPFIGTYIAVPVFVFLTMLYYGLRKWFIMILVSVLVTLFLFFVFKLWLMVPLPQGVFFKYY